MIIALERIGRWDYRVVARRDREPGGVPILLLSTGPSRLVSAVRAAAWLRKYLPADAAEPYVCILRHVACSPL